MMLDFGAFLFYFGGLVIPALYLALTLGRGIARKPMLIGGGIHLFWTLAVLGFVCYCRRAGYTDYYYGWFLLWPVNIVSAAYYTGVLFWKYLVDRLLKI